MISALDAVLVLMLLVALISGRVPISAAFMLFILAVLVTGRISVTQGLQLLSDPATVAVICLVLFSNVLGRLPWLRMLLFDRHQHGLRRTLLRFLSVTGIVSAMLPNTAVVGAFMGPAARRADISAHQLLMPLSYMALAGGMVTHFGTTANLMVVGQAEKYGIDLTSFQFMPIGLAVMAAVLVVLVIVSPLLLRAPDQSGNAHVELFHVEARVKAGSPLVGRTLIENKLRNLGHFYVAELIRDDHIFSPVGPYEPLNENDVLIFVGDVRYIEEISSLPGLEIEHEARPRPKQNIYHAVVSANSTLTGTNLKEARFRGRFDASVFAVRRGNERLSGKLGEIRLKGGDLLVLAAGSDFYARDDVRANLHIVDVEDPGQSKLTRASTIFVSLLFLAFVAVALTEVVNFTLATLLLVSIGFFGGFLNLRDLRRSFPFELVVALWGALMLGTLIASSGMADVAATWIVHSVSSAPPFAVLIVVFIFTWLLTEMLSNTSAALAALPVALQVAKQMGLSPEALALTVAFGASASFLLPFGYQTHLMVMSPGNYQALDFIKLGSIVLICYAAVALTMIHWLYF
jgi:di/tricarboxylate transporter